MRRKLRKLSSSASGQKLQWESDKKQRNLTRKLEREEEAILKRIDELSEEHRKLTSRLAEPEVYIDGALVKEIGSLIQANEDLRDKLQLQWESVAEELMNLKT